MALEKKHDPKKCCSFCGAGKDEGLTQLFTSKVTEASICAACSRTMFFLYTRIAQLEEVAEVHAKEMVAAGKKVNDDGTCNCTNCTYTRLFECDEIIDELMKRQNGEVATGTIH